MKLMKFETGKTYKVNIGYDKWAVFKVVRRTAKTVIVQDCSGKQYRKRVHVFHLDGTETIEIKGDLFLEASELAETA